jgi:BirA family biotin operon repressor/biotin-[acetyl-CoA-carboxylase] ligase
MSVVLFPSGRLATDTPESEATDGRGWLTALGAVAVAEVVEAWTGRDARIKWPNDVRIDGRKVAGILVERVSGRGAIVGIGLNVNLSADDFSDELREISTSIQILRGGGTVDRSDLARDLICRLDDLYRIGRSMGPESLSRPWSHRCEHIGRNVRIATPGGAVVGRLSRLDIGRGLILTSPVTTHSDGEQDVTIPLADVLSLEPDVDLVTPGG